MGLRELKETANQQFVRGKFAQSAQTYQQILRLAPRDPNMRVRHAEACRRAGDPLQAIASYRAAAQLLLELGCESRARGALKAALELDPNDPILQTEVARLDPNHQDPFSTSTPEPEALPLLPPLESVPAAAPPPAPTLRSWRSARPEELLRTPALPPIHRALPSAPSVPPLVPPVLLPAPRVSSASPTEKLGAAMANAAGALPPTIQRSTPSAPRAPAAQAPALQAPRNLLTPPPPPREALFNSPRAQPQAALAPEAPVPAPSQGVAPRLEVRRLSATALAFRCSPNDSWAVIRSHSPLEVHVVESLDQLPPMLRDFTVDITVDSAKDSASSPVH